MRINWLQRTTTGLLEGIDFGVKYAADTFHDNIIIRVKGDKTLKANSLIMSLNSPVFDHLITDLGQGEIYMELFDEAATTRFFRALYCGEIGKLTRLSQLQDMTALAHIYNIPWLTTKCLNFLIENPFSRVAAEFIRKMEKSSTWNKMEVSELRRRAEEEAAMMPPPIKPEPLPDRQLKIIPRKKADGAAKTGEGSVTPTHSDMTMQGDIQPAGTIFN